LNQLNNGPNAGNYQMYVVATAQSGESTNTMIAITVQQRAFSIRGSFTASSKTYDRSASATIATNSLTPGLIDVLDGDQVSLVPVVTFANANAGSGKTVSLSASSTLTGAQAGNYYITLSGAPTATANINQQALTITPPTFSKTYDRTTSATAVGNPVLNGVVSGDNISISGSPTFTYTQASVGTSIPVTASVAYGAIRECQAMPLEQSLLRRLNSLRSASGLESPSTCRALRAMVLMPATTHSPRVQLQMQTSQHDPSLLVAHCRCLQLVCTTKLPVQRSQMLAPSPSQTQSQQILQTSHSLV
jgi:hypothetical protein